MKSAIPFVPAIDVQTATFPQSEWGEALEDWKGLILQQVQASGFLPEIRVRVSGQVVTLTGTNIPKDLMPGVDFTDLVATHEGAKSRVVFLIDGRKYQIRAQGKANERKRVEIDVVASDGCATPTPWVAEDCSAGCEAPPGGLAC